MLKFASNRWDRRVILQNIAGKSAVNLNRVDFVRSILRTVGLLQLETEALSSRPNNLVATQNGLLHEVSIFIIQPARNVSGALVFYFILTNGFLLFCVPQVNRLA